MVNKTVNINDLVKIDESFQMKGYLGDWIICHSDYPILHAENPTRRFDEHKKGDEVKKYAIALGLDSGDYHEADYDPTLDYESIEKFIGEAYGTHLVIGYGLRLERKYEVNGITFELVDDDNYKLVAV